MSLRNCPTGIPFLRSDRKNLRSRKGRVGRWVGLVIVMGIVEDSE
jgi:hypothetical protein